jgi:hypothetical protein
VSGFATLVTSRLSGIVDSRTALVLHIGVDDSTVSDPEVYLD